MPIRPATPADAQDVRDCVDAAYSLYLDRMDRPPAPMSADYDALIAQSAVHVLDEDGIVGVLVSFPHGDCYFIENVAVHPSVQSAGHGRRLLDFAEQLARANGLAELCLYTNEAMRENLAFYPRLGWRETDRREEGGFRRVYFRKSVPPPPP